MVAETFHVTVFERVLDHFLGLVGRVCAEFAGTNRISRGDSYVSTFPNAAQALAAADRLLEEWGAFQRRENIRCPMNIMVHRGELYAFRSFLLGPDLNLVMDLETATSQLASGGRSSSPDRCEKVWWGAPGKGGSTLSTSGRCIRDWPISRSTASGTFERAMRGSEIPTFACSI